MKKTIKHISVITVIAMLAVLILSLASCGAEPADINVAIIKGPTGVGMASLMDKNADGKAKNNYTFTLASSPDEIVPKIVTGEIDIAAVPTNLAATLYKKTEGNIRMLAVNTLGVLHILENGDSISSAADLKGKTIYTSGQGANPEYVLRYVLEKNGIDPDKDVTIEFVGTNDELVGALVSGKANVAMVPEPAATTVLSKVETLRRALDMSSEWDKVSGGESSLMMGCVIVRADFLEANEDAVKAFLKEYEESIKVCENAADAAALCEKYEIIPSAAVAEKAIPNCNITFVSGKDMKAQIEGYFKVLFDGNPASIGGELPDEKLYYLG
ncbi:MAG: ABC transporter substrate-binding protein [Clostridiales bacterium]|nr:ABC transporter substrate-binding protein [Clostridiales bacterium]